MTGQNIIAPELVEGLWLNSERLTIAGLRGKVIVLAFWTYSNGNSLQTLPFLKTIHERYEAEGLVVIGVHSPRFSFEKHSSNLKKIIEREKISFPIVLDNEFSIWKSYANDDWPHRYFIDTQGRIRGGWEGSGGHESSEHAIQALLKERNPALAHLPSTTDYGEIEELRRPSVELFAGFLGGSVGNPTQLKGDLPRFYADTGERRENLFYLSGAWLETPEFVKHARRTLMPEDYLGIRYRESGVSAVMGLTKDGTSSRIYVTRDGQNVPESARGSDVQEDAEGTYVEVSFSRVYQLIKEKPGSGRHDLTLTTQSDSLAIYSLSLESEPSPSTMADLEQRAS